MKKTTIKNRITLSFSVVSIVIFVLLSIYITSRVLSFQTKQSYQNANELTEKLANQINTSLEERYGFLNTIKLTLESDNIKNREQGVNYLKFLVQNNKSFQGIYMMYNNDAFDGKDEDFKGRLDLGSNTMGHYNPWWYWSEDKLNFGQSESDYFEEEYFAKTVKENKSQLIEPYMDTDINILMSSLTYPIEKNGEAIGIVGGDITLDYLDKLISEIKFLKHGYIILISKNGTFLSYPKKELIGMKTLEDFAKENKNNELLKFAQDINNQKANFIEAIDPLSKKKAVFFSQTFGRGDWTIITIANKSEILANVYELIIGMTIFVIIAMIIFIYLAKIIAGRISKPINEMTAVLKNISEGEGDLTVKIEVNSNDETSDMAHYFNKFVEHLKDMILEFIIKNQNISKNSNQLYEEAGKLLTQSDSINKDVEKLSHSSEIVFSEIFTIKSAIEEASSNIGALADETSILTREVNSAVSSSEQTDSNVKNATNELKQVVSSIDKITQNANNLSEEMKSSSAAVIEMSSSISEVADHAKDADVVAEEAKSFTEEAHHAMSELETSAKEIKKIVSLIEQITDQTNLLALNATIEAASAGEAGKGFAVVANEVKVLAKSTAQATNQIADRIDIIQQNVDNVVNLFNRTILIIEKLYNINHTIALTVEQQSMAANEISSSVEKSANNAEMINSLIVNINELSQIILKSIIQASNHVTSIANNTNEISNISNDISRNSQEAHIGVNEISKSTNEINDNIMQMGNEVNQIFNSAKTTADQANSLNNIATDMISTVEIINKLINRFKVK